MNEFYNKLKYFEKTEGIAKDVYYLVLKKKGLR